MDKERKLLMDRQLEWSDKYVNIYKIEGLYAVKLASSNIINSLEDSSGQFLALNYFLEDFSGKMVYSTENKSEFYDLSLNNQLLDGFNILARKYERGDSVMAIIPSDFYSAKGGHLLIKYLLIVH